jgi:hypothetical protein
MPAPFRSATAAPVNSMLSTTVSLPEITQMALPWELFPAASM